MDDQATQREDEALMLAGLGWREAASTTNETISPESAIAVRCYLAGGWRG